MKNKKSILVKIISLLVFAGSGAILYGIATVSYPPKETIIPEWYVDLTVFFAFLYMLSVYWTWRMQKRGAELYAILTIIADVLGGILGILTIDTVIVPLIFTAIFFIHYKQMSGPSFLKRN